MSIVSASDLYCHDVNKDQYIFVQKLLLSGHFIFVLILTLRPPATIIVTLIDIKQTYGATYHILNV
jgi:hypothetical protein